MASSYPDALVRLIEQFKRHPGIGPKSAERLAFYTLSRSPGEVAAFAEALTMALEKIRACPTCFSLAEDGACPICRDPRRDDRRLCVVEAARDVFVFERGGVWSGRYHVLEGLVSPLDGVGPEDLRVRELEERVEAGAFEEVVLGLNPSAEGEATGIYIADLLAEHGVPVTRIAYGLPVGGELEFADPVTLQRALEGRRGV